MHQDFIIILGVGNMFQIPEVSNLTDALKDKIRETSEQKVKNSEIQTNLTNKIDNATKYFAELEKGIHISEEALAENPGFLPGCQISIKNCITILTRLRSLINSVTDSYDDFSYMESINLKLENIDKEYDRSNFFRITADVGKAEASFLVAENFITNFNTEKEMFNLIVVDEVKEILREAEKELKDFKKTKSILKNLLIEDYYSLEYKKNMWKHYIYFAIFILIIIASLGISIYTVTHASVYKLDKYDYWFMKISFILVAITLVSYFIKQSSHYQKMADQANQTRLEIQAFPSFIGGVSQEDEVSLRKELALKYFGREIDSTAHKDMSNLITDQMKSTTEMVKAVTDVIKKPGNS